MQTNRLLLRPAAIADIDSYIAIQNSEFVQRYNATRILTREQALTQLEAYAQREDLFFIEERATGRLIGEVNIEPDELRYKVEAVTISYYLDEAYCGQGYMTEALTAVMNHLFETKTIELISARVFSENTASAKLLKRLGFVQEGCLRRAVKGYSDIIYDDLIFSLLREEWSSKL